MARHGVARDEQNCFLGKFLLEGKPSFGEDRIGGNLNEEDNISSSFAGPCIYIMG